MVITMLCQAASLLIMATLLIALCAGLNPV